MSSESGSVGVTAPTIPDYELVRVIGRGSYGDVWLARGVTGLWRAIKVVWRTRFAEAEPFEREFRGLREFAAVSLGESIQLALLHVGRNDAAGFFYYVMELADDAERGRQIDPACYVPLTLAELRTRRGRLPAADGVRFGTELARVLAGLHRRGLVHRDIKPSNVILVDGVPKLADIGLVAPAANAPSYIGTEGFVPPEGPGSTAADVFALGKVLYELSTGLDRHDFPQLPPALDRLPDSAALIALNRVVLRACDPRPERRYRDGTELHADLQALQVGRPGRRFRPARALALASILVLAAAVAVIAVFAWRVPPRSVVVLPFVNLGSDRSQDYFGASISDEILSALARERGLLVIGSASSAAFDGQPHPPAEIARRLHAAYLVEGSVLLAGSHVRINVRFTRTADGVMEDLGPFHRELTDIFALQDEVARAVAVKIVHRTIPSLVAEATKNPEAYDLYLRGRALQVHSSFDTRAAIELFERAVKLDPQFALAWVRLGEAQFRLNHTPSGVPPVRIAVEKALAAQPDFPPALSLRGLMRGVGEHDLVGGRLDIARAEALQGPTADTRMQRLLIEWEASTRDGIEALARAAIAADPENGDRAGILAGLMFALGDFPEADRLYARAASIAGPSRPQAFQNRVWLRRRWRGGEAALRLIDRAPANQAGAIAVRVEMLLGLGRREEARALLEKTTDSVPSYLLANAGLTERARRAAEAGRDEAQAALDRGRMGPEPHFGLAAAAITLGDRDLALAELNTARQALVQNENIYNRWNMLRLNVIPFYARLDARDTVIALLQEGIAAGFPPALELRDSLDYATVRDDKRFQELIRMVEARAAAQPDPTDDPFYAATRRTKL
jgi:TolB-like protein/thioredoxin-like negative regulator of GroEL